MSVKVLEYDRDDPAWLHDEDEYSDFDDGEVREGGLFDADGEEWEWLDSESDVVHLDFDNWQVWSASNGPEVAYFVVDIDTGFIDWGPCDTLDEAKEFLDGKIEDWELESVKTEKIEGVNGSENQMTITVGSHLNSDGFDVHITDPDGNEIFEMDYAYGWDASYDRRWASKDKPYVSDIINELVQEYNVDRSSIKVVNGKNVFNGKDSDKASEFSSKYLECTNTGDISNAPAKHIRMFKDLDKREESVKTESANLSPELTRFRNIVKDMNKYTGIILRNIEGDSDMKGYMVGSAVVKLSGMIDQMIQIRDSLN